MNDKPAARLIEHFQSLSDEELFDRAASGDLTDEAQTIANAQILARGFALPQVTADSALQQPATPYPGDWVVLERHLGPTEAQIICSCLQAAGLQVNAGDMNIVQANSLLSIAVGGVSIKVRSSSLDEAKAVLAAYRRGDFALDENFDPNANPR